MKHRKIEKETLEGIFDSFSQLMKVMKNIFYDFLKYLLYWY